MIDRSPKVSMLFAAASVFVLGMAASAPALAEITSVEPASGLCKAASGPGADVFYFDADYVQNTSTSTQYLTCTVPDIDRAGGASEPTNIFLHFENPSGVAKTFTCVAITRHGGDPSAVSVMSQSVAAGNTHATMNFTAASTPALPLRGFNAYYALSCAIPAEGKMVSIEVNWSGTIPL